MQFEKGHEKLTGKKLEYEKEIEQKASSLKETVSSWWDKTKSLFSRSKKDGGEEAVNRYKAGVDEAKTDFQKKADAIVSGPAANDNVIDLQAERAKREGVPAETKSQPMKVEAAKASPAKTIANAGRFLREGDTDGLRSVLKELGSQYDSLAQEVAAEGSKEQDTQKKNLAEGLNVAPESIAGKQLNEIARLTQAVRMELSKSAAVKETPKAKPPAEAKAAEAPAAAKSAETPASAEQRRLAAEIQNEIDMYDQEGWTGETLKAINDAKMRRDAALALAKEIEAGGTPQKAGAGTAVGSKQESAVVRAKLVEAPKNFYDRYDLSVLKEHLDDRKGGLKLPDLFTGKEREEEEAKIAAMEESLARRGPAEAPPAEQAPAAEKAEESAVVQEKFVEAPKNFYDRFDPWILKKQLLERKESLKHAGRFTGKKLAEEEAKIAAIEESIERRISAEEADASHKSETHEVLPEQIEHEESLAVHDKKLAERAARVDASVAAESSEVEAGQAVSPAEPVEAVKAETPKNRYDEQRLSGLESDVIKNRERLAKNPGDKVLATKLEQMEESLARRSSPEGLAMEIAGLQDWKSKLEAQKAEMESPQGIEQYVKESFAPKEYRNRGEGTKESTYIRGIIEAWKGGKDLELQEQVSKGLEAERKSFQERIDINDKEIAEYEKKMAEGKEAPAEAAPAEAAPVKPEAKATKSSVKQAEKVFNSISDEALNKAVENFRNNPELVAKTPLKLSYDDFVTLLKEAEISEKSATALREIKKKPKVFDEVRKIFAEAVGLVESPPETPPTNPETT
jgi:hypothetical protein